MSAIDASELNFWSWVSWAGIWLVIIGVAVEGPEAIVWLFHKFINLFCVTPKPRLKKRLVHKLDQIGWSILLVGLLVEWWGHSNESRVNERVIIQLTGQLGGAIKSAGQANERASTNELAAKALDAANLVLRSNVVALELKLRPRTITQEQRENFIKLSEKSQKGVVKFIWTLAGGVECEKYNDQIMNMTTNAGYILVDHGSQAGRQFDFNGVVVAVRGPHEFPPFFVTILNSMNEIGVSVKGGFDANLTSEEVLIWVGPKD